MHVVNDNFIVVTDQPRDCELQNDFISLTVRQIWVLLIVLLLLALILGQFAVTSLLEMLLDFISVVMCVHFVLC